jgi:hypothetical protein
VIAALVSVGVTVAISALGAAVAYGRNVQAVTALGALLTQAMASAERSERETRETLQRFGERLGRVETRGEVEREFSGKVRT